LTKAERLAVGLISGTSLDGVDAALVRISGPAERPRVKLLAFSTVPYPHPLRSRLLEVAAGERTTSGELSNLNFLLGDLFAAAALRVCRQGLVAPGRLSVIGSHGQTIFHQGRSRPGARLDRKPPTREAATHLQNRASTLQIAEPAIIAARTGVPVVADFRTADMAAGGEGAPLVPLVDYLVLRDSNLNTVALNIGGIANLTAIPAGASAQQVFGFDTGPGNMVMDGLMRHFSRGRRNYDRGGRLAAQGRVIESLLSDLLHHPFITRRPPKSAGREQFGRVFIERHFLSRRGASFEDLVRTGNEFTAMSIAKAIERFIFPQLAVRAGEDRLIVSGGGAHNPLLLARLAELLPQLQLRLADDYGLPADAKEAMALALLADRTLRRLPGNLPAVTGACRAVVLGKVSHP